VREFEVAAVEAVEEEECRCGWGGGGALGEEEVFRPGVFGGGGLKLYPASGCGVWLGAHCVRACGLCIFRVWVYRYFRRGWVGR